MADVLPHGIVKEEHLLVHHRELCQHPLCGDSLDGLTADGDGPALRLIEFGDQIQNRGFARAGVPHDGGEFPVRDGEGHPLQDRLSRHIGERHIPEGDVVPLRGKGRALPGLLRLLNQILNVPFGDHQVLPFKEINGNTGGELGQQNGQHGEHQIVHAAQCPRRPWPGGQHHDKRHAAPADDIVAESDGDALGFVLVAHPAELLHGLGDGPVFYAAHVVRPEHLNAVNVLHNATHRLGADLVFRHAVHLYHPEGQPQVGNQQRDNRQQDQPRR